MNVDIFIIGKICAKLDKFPKCRHFDNYLEFSEAIFQIVDILIGSLENRSLFLESMNPNS